MVTGNRRGDETDSRHGATAPPPRANRCATAGTDRRGLERVPHSWDGDAPQYLADGQARDARISVQRADRAAVTSLRALYRSVSPPGLTVGISPGARARVPCGGRELVTESPRAHRVHRARRRDRRQHRIIDEVLREQPRVRSAGPDPCWPRGPARQCVAAPWPADTPLQRGRPEQDSA